MGRSYRVFCLPELAARLRYTTQQFLTVGDQLRSAQGHDGPGALNEVILQILEQES
jgi:hypothetical protein